MIIEILVDKSVWNTQHTCKVKNDSEEEIKKGIMFLVRTYMKGYVRPKDLEKVCKDYAEKLYAEKRFKIGS